MMMQLIRSIGILLRIYLSFKRIRLCGLPHAHLRMSCPVARNKAVPLWSRLTRRRLPTVGPQRRPPKALSAPSVCRDRCRVLATPRCVHPHVRRHVSCSRQDWGARRMKRCTYTITERGSLLLLQRADSETHGVDAYGTVRVGKPRY